MGWKTGWRNLKPQAFLTILEAVISRSASMVSLQAFINETVEKLKAKE